MQQTETAKRLTEDAEGYAQQGRELLDRARQVAKQTPMLAERFAHASREMFGLANAVQTRARTVQRQEQQQEAKQAA